MWPSNKVLGYGHSIVDLDAAVRELMAENVSSGAQPAYSERALGALNADTIWPLLRDGLENYGSGGRYHYLDWVTRQPQYDSPRGYWDAMERKVLAQQPDLFALLASVAPGAFGEGRRRTNEAIVASLETWWRAVHTYWLQGAFGAAARMQSGTINPEDVFAR